MNAQAQPSWLAQHRDPVAAALFAVCAALCGVGLATGTVALVILGAVTAFVGTWIALDTCAVTLAYVIMTGRPPLVAQADSETADATAGVPSSRSDLARAA